MTLNLWTLLTKPSIQMSLLDCVVMWAELGLIAFVVLGAWVWWTECRPKK